MTMRMFEDSDLRPISALQHLAFCKRQCALIHIEQVWADNSLTFEGHRLHRKVDEAGARRERRGDVIILRGLSLKSYELGLIGIADVVELHRSDRGSKTDAVDFSQLDFSVRDLSGHWTVSPVEYKRGKPKKNDCDRIQLCAQALCLEERLNTRIEFGALYYGTSGRRTAVELDSDLRSTTIDACHELHGLLNSRTTPMAESGPKCRSCSLKDICMPELLDLRENVQAYLTNAIDAPFSDEGVDS